MKRLFLFIYLFERKNLAPFQCQVCTVYYMINNNMINWNWSGIGALDAYVDDLYPDDNSGPKTERSPEKEVWPTGDFSIVSYDDYQPLFTSASWVVTMKINGKLVETSNPSDKPHTVEYVNRWTKQLIRTRKAWLKSIGVNVEKEYKRYGGDITDLT